MGISKELSKGLAAYEKRNFSQAVKEFTKALELEQNNIDAIEQRSMSYFHLGDYSSSLKDMNRARDLEPNNPYRYSSRAYLKATMKDIDGAIEDYKIAVHLDPEDSIAHNNLGLLQEQKGYMKEAKTNFSIADKLSGTETKGLPQDVEGPEFRSKGEVIKHVFRNKSGAKEFLDFILNGFRLKK